MRNKKSITYTVAVMANTVITVTVMPTVPDTTPFSELQTLDGGGLGSASLFASPRECLLQ